MKNLHITVADKIATYLKRDGVIVCANKGEESGYQIVFAFDAEWSAYTKKTARFIWNGKYYDQQFEGNECPVPIITNTTEVTVGVYAGDLSTTTPATIPCKKSILCGSNTATDGQAKEYRDEALIYAERAERAALEAAKAARDTAEEFVAELGVVQEPGADKTSVMSQNAASRTFANAIKATASGNIVVIDEVSPVAHDIKAKVSGVADPSGVTVYTCGKNLCPAYSSFSSVSGINITKNSDGSITLNGTATATANIDLIPSELKIPLPAGKYTLSLGTNLPQGVTSALVEYELDLWQGNLCEIPSGSSSQSVNIENHVKQIKWYLSVASGQTVRNLTLHPQLELGEESEYEEYKRVVYTTDFDGIVSDVISISPRMTVFTDNADATINLEYSRDLVKVIEESEERVMAVAASSFANAIKNSASGKIVRAENVSPTIHNISAKVSGVADPSGLTVYVCGKNLCPSSVLPSSISGITITKNGNGSITLNGTATANANIEFIPVNANRPLPVGEYTISLGTNLPQGVTSAIARFKEDLWVGNLGDIPSGSSSKCFSVTTYAEQIKWYITIPSGKTVNNLTVYPQLEVGVGTEYAAHTEREYTPRPDGVIDNLMSISPVMTLFAGANDAVIDIEYTVDFSEEVKHINESVNNINGEIDTIKVRLENINDTVNSNFPYADYSLPIVSFVGSTAGMTKDDKVTLNYSYDDRSGTVRQGTCTLKWQGSSSIKYPKKNYTVVFDNAFEAATGWGAQSKYCLKADWIDFSHCRNVVSAKLWGQMVKTRSGADSRLLALPNCGAVDGFPCFVVINDEWQGVYNFNIPKEGWMMGMGSGAKEAIVCAEGTAANSAEAFKADAVLGTHFSLEYNSDSFTESAIQASINTLINACINSDGTDIDTTIAQYLDINSAIDHYIFCALLRAEDCIVKNYILATYDGVKWFFSAYDLDSTFGLAWDGNSFLNAGRDSWHTSTTGKHFNALKQMHRLYELLYTHKKAEIVARYEYLTARNYIRAFNPAVLPENFYNYASKIPLPAYNADAELWKTIPSSSVNNVAQITNWYAERVRILDDEIKEMKATL